MLRSATAQLDPAPLAVTPIVFGCSCAASLPLCVHRQLRAHPLEGPTLWAVSPSVRKVGHSTPICELRRHLCVSSRRERRPASGAHRHAASEGLTRGFPQLVRPLVDCPIWDPALELPLPPAPLQVAPTQRLRAPAAPPHRGAASMSPEDEASGGGDEQGSAFPMELPAAPPAPAAHAGAAPPLPLPLGLHCKFSRSPPFCCWPCPRTSTSPLTWQAHRTPLCVAGFGLQAGASSVPALPRPAP